MAMVGLVGAGMEVVDCMHAGQSRESRVRGDAVMTLITPLSRCTAQGRVEPELVGFPGKALTWAPREGSGSLSMQPVSYTPWCSTDAMVS